MSRGKNRGASTPRGSRGGRGGTRQRVQQRQQQYAPQIHSRAALGFTLADEARQTSQLDHSSWSSNTLRQKPVAFVSAGTSDPLEHLNVLSQSVEAEKPGNLSKAPQETAIKSCPEQDVKGISSTESEDKITGPIESDQGIVVSSGTHGQPEQIGFFYDVGSPKTHAKPRYSPTLLPDRSSSPQPGSEDEVILFKGRESSKWEDPGTTITLSPMHTEIQAVEEQLRESSTRNSSVVKPTKSRKSSNQRTGQHNGYSCQPDDDLMADYIQNMRDNGEIGTLLSSDTRNQRELGGPENVLTYSSTDEGKHQNGEKDVIPNNDHVDVTTSTTIKSTGLPHTPSRNRDTSEGPANASGSELDDESLARLISGQDSAGEHTLALVEDSGDSDSSSADDKVKCKQPGDPTNDFDPMDWEQPNPRRRKGKGARGQVTFNVSDSELEQALQAAWSNNRMKKSQRKKEREELRALGQLGRGGHNPEDLQVKYPAGMDLNQIAEELKAFLLGNDESLTLPPMDKHARKMIHELANKFNIKSKSAGKADHRRPVLYRSKRTMPYVASTFEQAIGRMQRRYFPRLDNRSKRNQESAPSRSGHTAASYRDGEIVGAAAPELGLENRGWAMMEKMGWSSGTALGATHNKGILEPVSQAVKRSKAGLG